MKNANILVVEDEVIISLAIKETLSNLGYHQVETAYDVPTAFKLLRKNNYDLVLMDIKLGGEQDGIDIVNSINEKFELSVIYVTGNSDQKTIQKAKLSTPYGFITKPISGPDLEIQMEIALHKEDLKQLKIEEEEAIGSIYVGDCTGLYLKLGMEGEIISISPLIKKITGKPSYFYKWKTINNADFDKPFYDILANILDKVKYTEQRSFYGDVPSVFIGERLVKIEINNNNNNSFQLDFFDLTDSLFRREKGFPTSKIIIASGNPDITGGFKFVPNFVENIKISAELNDSKSVTEYLSVTETSTKILVIDIDLDGGCETVLTYISENNLNKVKVMIMLVKEEVDKLRSLTKYNFIGYFSKLATDATILEAMKLTLKGKNYYDPNINKYL